MTDRLRCEPAPGLIVFQPARGYRYAMDPFLLAGWALERPARTFFEGGTGCGVLSLLLARLGLEGEGMDVLPEWVALAEAGRMASGLEGRVRFSVGDLREPPTRAPADLALCNPPYLPLDGGPVSPDPMRAAARHERHGALPDLVRGLSLRGRRVALVLPAGRAAEGERALEVAGLPLRRRCDLPPALVLLEGGEGEGGEGTGAVERRVEPLRTDAGEHSPAVRAWYARLDARLAFGPSGNT